jgi:outer membrane protein W
MRRLVLALALTLVAAPLLAQSHLVLFGDVEGVRRTGHTTAFAPNTARYEPLFEKNGAGFGGGLDWFFTDRVSLEVKVAGVESRLRIRSTGSDFVLTADIGRAQLYPVTAVLRWHLLPEGRFITPYIGAGVSHIVLRNIERQVSASGRGVRFSDPTGLVLNAGTYLNLSSRWSITADARYVPIETNARATIVGTSSSSDFTLHPLLVSTGLGYRF